MTVNNEAYVFLCSILGGMLIAFIYDLFRIKRKLRKTTGIFVYIEDFVYWILVALVMFGVVYYSNDGELRGYIFLGTAIGVVLYIILLSNFVVGTSLFVIDWVCKIFKVVWRILTYPIRIVLSILMVPARFIFKFIKGMIKKLGRSGKNNIRKLAVWKKRFKNIRKKY